MRRFEIYPNSRENCCVIVETKNNHRDINEMIYETLSEWFDVDDETRVNIACWCELACVGDVYETDDLTLIVQK